MGRLFIIVSIFFFIPVSAQHVMVLSNNEYFISYKKHKGYVELNDGSKIWGIFQYASDEFPTYNIKYLELTIKY